MLFGSYSDIEIKDEGLGAAHIHHIIVTFVNTEWILLAQNWICSATRVGLQNSLYLIAVAPDVCSHFPTTPCYQHPSLSLPGALYAQPEYQKFMIERTKLVLSILSCTKSKILLSDSDIVFLRNPIPILNNELLVHDIVFQEDSTGEQMLDNFATYVYSAICGGFMYLKPNNRTMDLFLSVLAYQLNWNWNDQSGINICIRWHGRYISWKTLDKSRFPNGKEFFEFNRNNKGAMVIHANFIRYIPDKVGKMMSQGVWCLKDTINFHENVIRAGKSHSEARGNLVFDWQFEKNIIVSLSTEYRWAARALSLPVGRTLSSPAAGLFPPRRQDSFLLGGRTLSSPAAAGLSPPRRQDSHLPGDKTLSSPAAGLFPPRRQDSFLPGGRTLSSPAAGLSPPRRQYSLLPGGRTLTTPAASAASAASFLFWRIAHKDEDGVVTSVQDKLLS
eukprot:Em0009g373a